MENRFEELRKKIDKVSLTSFQLDPIILRGILSILVDELEKVHNEMRQGFTRPE